MILASMHVAAMVAVPMAIAAGLVLVWYWFRMGASAVPPSRRRIRRVSVVLMLASLPMFLRGLSFLDPTVQPREYLLTWMIALLMLLLILITAIADVVNNMLIHRRLRGSAMASTFESHRESPR